METVVLVAIFKNGLSIRLSPMRRVKRVSYHRVIRLHSYGRVAEFLDFQFIASGSIPSHDQKSVFTIFQFAQSIPRIENLL